MITKNNNTYLEDLVYANPSEALREILKEIERSSSPYNFYLLGVAQANIAESHSYSGHRITELNKARDSFEKARNISSNRNDPLLLKELSKVYADISETKRKIGLDGDKEYQIAQELKSIVQN